MLGRMRVVMTEKKPPHPLTKEAVGALKAALSANPEALLIVYQLPDGEFGWQPVPKLHAVEESLIRGACDVLMGRDGEE